MDFYIELSDRKNQYLSYFTLLNQSKPRSSLFFHTHIPYYLGFISGEHSYNGLHIYPTEKMTINE
ncbi:MAG: hypothetical protein WCS17_01875 [Prevotella sp.]